MFMQLRWLQDGRSPKERGERKSSLHAPLLVSSPLFLSSLDMGATVSSLTGWKQRGTNACYLLPSPSMLPTR